MDCVSYVKALGKHWWALMSCAVFTAIGIIAAAFSLSNIWVVWVSAAAAFVLLLFASFLAWNDEHNRAELEISRNQHPEIKGEILVAFSDIGQAGNALHNTSLAVLMKLTNHKDVPTTIDKYELRMNVGHESRAAIGNPNFGLGFTVEHDSDYPATTRDEFFSRTPLYPISFRIRDILPLRRSISAEGWVLFEFKDAVPTEEVDSWDEDFNLIVTDSLGGVHSISAPHTRVIYGEIKSSS